MPVKIESPARITAAGNMPKVIDEFIGNVNSKTDSVSIAKMISPCGWIEPGQQPEFTEYTIVLKGMLRVTTKNSFIDVNEGQAIIVENGEWIQYSSPNTGGAEYISVCLPAFSPATVHRDELI